ncbi:MAG: HDIG domain-containing protein [Dehalococcoidia bacterium]|nr:HDIG domain-containing protein [Dehalococcoidia bacterium]
MTNSPPVARVRRFSVLSARDRATLFAIGVAWLVFGALYPFFSGAQRLDVGTVTSTELRAPLTVSYTSQVITRERRDQAAANVPEVRVLDASVRVTQLATLDRRLGRIEVVRRDVTLASTAREAAIGAITEGRLSERSAALLAIAPEPLWQFLAGQARSSLFRVLAAGLVEADLPEQRERLAATVGTDIEVEQTRALAELLTPLVVPTIVVDRGRTNALRAEAAAGQPDVSVTVRAGEVVAAAGEVLTAAGVERLDVLGLRSSAPNFWTLGAAVLFSALVGAVWGAYLLNLGAPALDGLRRPVLVAFLVALPLLVARLAFPRLLPDDSGYHLAYAVPLAATPMLAAVLLDAGAALLVATTVALGVGVLTGFLPPENGALGDAEGVQLMVAAAASSVVGVLLASRAQGLVRFLGAGAGSALAAFGSVAVFWFLAPERAVGELGWAAVSIAAGGLASGFVTAALFVVLSPRFGIVTRAQLMDLAQINHPLLRRLQDEAPGTFQHAVLVGNLAERAADRIGADALLVRVGAYYHDIGKLTSPAFFIENVHSDSNPHEGLEPLQSTRVIHQHVTAGVELARRWGLPPDVARFIPQHHGTRLMTFFYRRAAEADPEIDPELFRYPGPRPQTRESAVVMLADACEATVRATLDRGEDRIRAIVDGIVRERIEEGQLDECDISMRDLAVVSDSFTRSLSAVYHPRVQYPEPTLRELDARRVDPLPSPPSAREPSTVAATGSPPPTAAP